MVSHMPKEKDATESASFSLTMYNENGEICSRNYEAPACTGLNIISEELLSEAGYTPTGSEILWYVVQSDSSSLISNQVHISAHGYIGGDHSF